MRNKLPVHIENRDLPIDKYVSNERRNVSYGYVNILYLTSMLITIVSVMTVIIFGK